MFERWIRSKTWFVYLAASFRSTHSWMKQLKTVNDTQKQCPNMKIPCFDDALEWAESSVFFTTVCKIHRTMNVLSFIFLSFLVLLSMSNPIIEDYSCDYEHCTEDDYFCATDGKEFQYFKNKCYLNAFNQCNRASEWKLEAMKILMTFSVPLKISDQHRLSTSENVLQLRENEEKELTLKSTQSFICFFQSL
jgi:hypothetical protein